MLAAGLPEYLALGGGGGHHFFPNSPRGPGPILATHESPPITSVIWVPLIVAFNALWMVACGASQKASLMMTLNTSKGMCIKERGGGHYM